MGMREGGKRVEGWMEVWRVGRTFMIFVMLEMEPVTVTKSNVPARLTMARQRWKDISERDSLRCVSLTANGITS